MRKNTTGRKRVYILTVVAAVMLFGFFAVPELTLAKMKIPEDFTMTATGDQPHVVFSHTYHVETQKLKCSNCHTKLFQMKQGKTAEKKGELTMAAMREGQFCGACHNGEKAFSVKVEDKNCAKCHIKE
jgi:c(7)-type cytochrome triheme protein